MNPKSKKKSADPDMENRVLKPGKPRHSAAQRAVGAKLKLGQAAAGLRVVLLLLTSGMAQAGTRWWDGGTTDIGSNGNSASGGGGGTWNTTILNWDAGASPHVAWNNANNDTAIFDGTAGTVNVAVPITVGGVIFNVAGYSFTSTPVEIASGAIVKGKGGVTASIAGFALAAGNTTYRFESTDTSTGAFGNTRIFTMPTSLTGAGNSVVISGTQPVYLTGTNSYGGTTTVNSGAAAGFNTADLDGMGSGSGARSILVSDGASLLRQGGSLNDAFLKRLVLTTNTFTIYANNAGCGNNLDLTGFPNASLATWDNVGTVSFTYTGTLTPASNTYRFGGARGGNYINLPNANTLTGARSLVVIPGSISKLRLQNANDFAGDTLIHSGTLYITHNLALQNSAIDTAAAGTMDVTGATAPTFGGLKGSKSIGTLITTGYGNVTSLRLNPATGVTNSYSGVLGNGAPGMTLTKSGLGTQILTGANTYSGATTISGGTLQIGDGGATGSIATTSGVTNNGTLVYNRSNNLSVGHVTSGSGSLIKQGAGTLTLTAAASYSGDTTVTAGTLSLSNPNPKNEASPVSIASGATLNLNFSGTDTVAKLFIGPTPMAAGVYKAVGNPGPGLGIAQLTGAGTLTVSGAQTPPTLVSIVDNKSGRPIAANTLVTYTVTFSEDMDASTVSAADFGNAGSSTISVGAILDTAPGVLTIQVTPTTAGTLRLQIPAGAILTDVAGRPLDTTSALLDDTTLTVFAPDPTSPTLRGISPIANNSGSSLSLAMPAGVVAGDLLIANIAQYGASSGNPTASGWTLINGRSLGGSTSHYGAVLYKVAAPSEAGPYVYTLTGTSPAAAGVILAFSGVDTSGGPLDAAPGSFYTGSAAATAVGPAAQVTTASPNAVVLMLGMEVSTPSATWSNWSTPSPGALNELYDSQGSGTGNNATSLGAAWAVKAAPGATGTGSATLSASARNGSILLALKPSYNAALLSALSALKDHITGVAPLDAAQVNAHKLTIDAQKALFGSSASAIAAALDMVTTYDSVIGPLWVAQNGFTRASVTNDIHWTIFNVMQYLMDLTYTAANIANHADLLNGFKFGSSANFPGACAPPADSNQTYTATINGNYLNTWGWPTMHEERPARKPTGTYLAPGSIATVTVPASFVGRGYQIRVGCHAWDFTEKPSVKRLDRVTLVYPINATETKVANPLGGGIYIEVPQYVTNVGIVNVQIKNAARSPYFSAKRFHQTTPAQWLTERTNAAPWADFQSEKYMMQVPTSWIYAMPDPTRLMKDWDIAADTCNDLMGFPHDRGKETMYDQVDLLLRGSAYFPGYPTGNNSYSPSGSYGGYANSYLVRGPQYAPDFQFHEHGHGFLFPKFPGETEAEVNLLHVAVWHQRFGYSLDEAFRKSRSGYPAYATLDTTAIAWMMCYNFVNGVPMEQVEKQYQLKGHAKFVDIARLFGWAKLNQYRYSFTSDYENNVARPTDVDRLLQRLSKNVGADMRPLFHFWGVPPVDNTSLRTNIAAAKLPASAAIYDTLVHYKSLVPTNNAAFQTFAFNWWGKQPSTNGYTEERNHAEQWDTYNEASAAAVKARAQGIIALYFPGGRPVSDYDAWAAHWPGANLSNPNADFDGDGQSNDSERVWGLNPTNAASRNLFKAISAVASGTFTYTRRTPALTGLNYTVWTSTNLTTWTQDSGATQPVTSTVADVQTVTVSLSPARLTGPNLFVRLRAAP